MVEKRAILLADLSSDAADIARGLAMYVSLSGVMCRLDTSGSVRSVREDTGVIKGGVDETGSARTGVGDRGRSGVGGADPPGVGFVEREIANDPGAAGVTYLANEAMARKTPRATFVMENNGRS